MNQLDFLQGGLLKAVDDTVDAVGPKEIAASLVSRGLWEDDDLEKLARRVKDKLNPKRRDVLSLEEFEVILMEGRKRNCHIIMNYLSGASFYEAPVPVEPKQRISQLTDSFSEIARQASEQMEILRAEMERVSKEFNHG